MLFLLLLCSFLSPFLQCTLSLRKSQKKPPGPKGALYGEQTRCSWNREPAWTESPHPTVITPSPLTAPFRQSPEVGHRHMSCPMMYVSSSAHGPWQAQFGPPFVDPVKTRLSSVTYPFRSDVYQLEEGRRIQASRPADPRWSRWVLTLKSPAVR